MKNKKFKLRRFRRGSLIGLMLVIGLCLAIIGWGMLHMAFGSRINSAMSVSRITAREAADAGLSHAVYAMNSEFRRTGYGLPMPYSDDGEVPNSNASFSYEIKIAEGAIQRDPNYYSNYIIKSTGLSGNEQRIVYGITDIINKLDYGLIVTDQLELKPDTLVDGYYSIWPDVNGVFDYGLGVTLPDGKPNAERHVKIGTTSILPDSIKIYTDTRVTGDLCVGIGGDVEEIIKESPVGGSITGPWYNLPTSLTIDPVFAPNDVNFIYSGSINSGSPWDANNCIRIPAPEDVNEAETLYLEYEDILVPANGYSLIFLGNIVLHITDKLDIGANSSTLYVGEPFPDANHPAFPSSLVIYLDGDLDVDNGGNINNLSKVPRNFWLFGTNQINQRWNIRNSGNYYGVYYGPQADIQTYASAQFYGSITGRTFVLDQDGGVHYDYNLSQETEFDDGFEIVRWWEEVVP